MICLKIKINANDKNKFYSFKWDIFLIFNNNGENYEHKEKVISYTLQKLSYSLDSFS